MWVVTITKAGIFRDIFGPFDTAQAASSFVTDNVTVPPDCSGAIVKVKDPKELHPDWPAPKLEKLKCWNCKSVTSHRNSRCEACGMCPLDYRRCPTCKAEMEFRNGKCICCDT